jgi:hypothetical protein
MPFVYATIKLTVKADVDLQALTCDTDYHFSHPDIIDTEWVDTELKENI